MIDNDGALRQAVAKSLYTIASSRPELLKADR